ncbi:hypothetical protein TVAG_007550 [Trichomonas vaginalis G3]|uniref:Uncharacterized protein n=1 Tax=Trichomonas vaginalis (strain ATCC PRA-98 / G3) TaxID=412133 RepID=A2FSY2_TRIV3|nr:hypothetical protein TVAGG3_0349190 [Trichomonas vaginalis G3]EAX91978.1 hypothetical protein TVAG_007550 [Trichomonas vaginalis G3]KAI5531162.1 hypothetical protein TVAGG3_0349190 [Trichomonas vaginalis G3]|eukprot:XP_001304908.1 hypothetical protein [Trichomonas vaginalis G3]
MNNSSTLTIYVIHEPNGFKYSITVKPHEKLSILNEIFTYSPKLQFGVKSKIYDESMEFCQVDSLFYAHPDIRRFFATDEISRPKANYTPDQRTIMILLMTYGNVHPMRMEVELDAQISSLLKYVPDMKNGGFMKRGHILKMDQTFREQNINDECWIYYIPEIEDFYIAHEAYGLSTQDKPRWPSNWIKTISQGPSILIDPAIRKRTTRDLLNDNF